MNLVVGAAILRGGKVLAARRTAPAELAGGWEFPGGKVDVGEDPDGAMVREVEEELGCVVEVTGWLGPTVPVTDALALRVATARILAGEPEPTEHDRAHDAVRWLGADELDEVSWLDADRPFLPEVAALLTEFGNRLRGIFFDADDAATVVARLRSDGWEAEIVRERYQGEDDDEDHPWAVVSDAPEMVMEMLVDEFDGWLDDGTPIEPGALPPPLDLPAAPKRIKRPQ